MVDRGVQRIGYVPEFRSEHDDSTRYLDSELRRISAEIEKLALGHIGMTYVEPVRPRDGDIRYADGTEWNPGSGAGLYQYRGSSWVFVG